MMIKLCWNLVSINDSSVDKAGNILFIQDSPLFLRIRALSAHFMLIGLSRFFYDDDQNTAAARLMNGLGFECAA